MIVRLILAVSKLKIYQPLADVRLGEINVRICYLIWRTKLATTKAIFNNVWPFPWFCGRV